MTTETATTVGNCRTIDRFRISRIGLIAKFYKRPVTKQLRIYAALTAVMFVIVALPKEYPIVATYPAIMILNFMCYLAPLPFATNGNPSIDIMLPARASEKYVYILLHSLIVVPLTIFVVWSVLWLLSFWWIDTMSFWTFLASNSMNFNEAVKMFNPQVGPWIIVSSMLSMLMPLTTAIAVILTARNSPVTKCILAVLATLFVQFIAGAIIGAIVAYANFAAMDNSTNFDEVVIVTDILRKVFLWICIPTFIYIVAALIYSYRKIALRQA